MARREVTEQIVREAPQIEALRMGLVNDALQLTRQPTQLPAYNVAGQAPLFQQGAQLAASGVGAYAPYLEGAAGAMGEGAGQLGAGAQVLQGGLGSLGYFPGAQEMVAGAGAGAGASSAEAMGMFRGATGAFDPSSVQGYLNPYMDDVESAIRRNFDRQQQQLNAGAVGAGAFGGSRVGIERALLGSLEGETVGRAYADQYNTAMGQAMQGFESQQGRTMAAGQGIGSLGLQNADFQRMAGMGSGQLAGQEADISRTIGLGIGSLGSELGSLGVNQAQIGALQSQLQGQDIQRLAAMGEMEREQQQRVLDANRQTDVERLYQPYQDLAFRSDIFRGAPSTQMAVTASTAPGQSTAQQVAGYGLAALAGARGIQKSGLF